MNVQADIQLLEGGAVKISIIVPPSGLKGLLDSLKGGKKSKVIKDAPDLAAKKKVLYDLIKKFKDNHPNLHPSPMYMDFYRHWGEGSKNGKNIRYEEQKYFDLGKRLATFRKRITPDELDKMWGEHNKLKPQQTLL